MTGYLVTLRVQRVGHPIDAWTASTPIRLPDNLTLTGVGVLEALDSACELIARQSQEAEERTR